MSRKSIVIISVSAFLALIATIALLVSKQKPNQPAGSQSAVSSTAGFPIANSENSSAQQQASPRPGSGKYRIYSAGTEGKSIISTPSGEKIEINDPEKNSTEKIDDKDYVLRSNPAYDIMYYKYSEGPSFLITLSSDNLVPTRAAAETDLLNILGISKDQACQLLVSLTVPNDVDNALPGGDYHLSFCPNGRSFK